MSQFLFASGPSDVLSRGLFAKWDEVGPRLSSQLEIAFDGLAMEWRTPIPVSSAIEVWMDSVLHDAERAETLVEEISRLAKDGCAIALVDSRPDSELEVHRKFNGFMSAFRGEITDAYPRFIHMGYRPDD